MLGCLIEKQRITPDQYPLSLNALRLAANQATNREPVVDYDKGTIRAALDRLGRRGWNRLASGPGSRVAKFRHLLDEALRLTPSQIALLAVLMLRGPQTVAELRTRSERLYPFPSTDDVERALLELSERGLAERLPRRPGERGSAGSSCSAATPPAASRRPKMSQRRLDTTTTSSISRSTLRASSSSSRSCSTRRRTPTRLTRVEHCRKSDRLWSRDQRAAGMVPADVRRRPRSIRGCASATCICAPATLAASGRSTSTSSASTSSSRPGTSPVGERPAILFVSAGGYHHHLGFNTWKSAGGSPQPDGVAGLHHVALNFSTRARLAETVQRLVDAGVPLRQATDHGTHLAVYLSDPDGNDLELAWTALGRVRHATAARTLPRSTPHSISTNSSPRASHQARTQTHGPAV